jgi:hypothetical protein
MNILSTGFATHVLHMALQASADILPINVEARVNKIFQYFHIYIHMVQVDKLKEFCNFIDAE